MSSRESIYYVITYNTPTYLLAGTFAFINSTFRSVHIVTPTSQELCLARRILIFIPPVLGTRGWNLA